MAAYVSSIRDLHLCHVGQSLALIATSAQLPYQGTDLQTSQSQPPSTLPCLIAISFSDKTIAGASAQDSSAQAETTRPRPSPPPPRRPPPPPAQRIGPVANQITSLPGLNGSLSSESYGGLIPPKQRFHAILYLFHQSHLAISICMCTHLSVFLPDLRSFQTCIV